MLGGLKLLHTTVCKIYASSWGGFLPAGHVSIYILHISSGEQVTF